MADLETELAELKTAYRSGVLSASYEGKTTTFRSLGDLAAAIASIESELGVGSPKIAVVRSNKGW